MLIPGGLLCGFSIALPVIDIDEHMHDTVLNDTIIDVVFSAVTVLNSCNLNSLHIMESAMEIQNSEREKKVCG